jgi:hypothetical protein
MALIGMQTRLTRQEYEAVRMLADKEQRSLSQSVRLLVREALEVRRLLQGDVRRQQEEAKR